MAEYDRGGPMPTTDRPLNAKPRGSVGPLLATLLMLAVVLGVLALSFWAVRLD